MSIQLEPRIKPKALVDMIPMIDIVFQLVIFFMVATTFKITTAMELNLPYAKSVNQVSSTPIKIVVIDKSWISVEGIKTDLDGMRVILSDLSQKSSSVKKSIMLYGDQKLDYDTLIEVMDILKLTGYNSINLAIKEKTEP